MENSEQAAFVAGFLEGIRHYAWYRSEDSTLVVGTREVPIAEALRLAKDEAPYYYNLYLENQSEQSR